jgi:hypothetical protein
MGVLSYWISPCYGPFSIEKRFETYESSFSLIFHFFVRAAVNRRTESLDKGARLYINLVLLST